MGGLFKKKKPSKPKPAPAPVAPPPERKAIGAIIGTEGSAGPETMLNPAGTTRGTFLGY